MSEGENESCVCGKEILLQTNMCGICCCNTFLRLYFLQYQMEQVLCQSNQLITHHTIQYAQIKLASFNFNFLCMDKN
jgi:hypothetical protein